MSCQAGCWIDSTFEPAAASKPDNACESCQPGVSSTDSTNVSDGTDCGNQQGCSAGICGSGCWIASTFYTPGIVNPNNGCQSCQPGSSTTGWTNKTDGADCGSGQVCSAGICGDCVPGRTRCKDTTTGRSASQAGPGSTTLRCALTAAMRQPGHAIRNVRLQARSAVPQAPSPSNATPPGRGRPWPRAWQVRNVSVPAPVSSWMDCPARTRASVRAAHVPHST